MKASLFIILNLFLAPLSFALDTVNMRPIFYSGDPKTSYKYQLLELLLNRTQAEFGPYRINLTNIIHSQKRDINQLKSGEINVFISMTSKAREDVMQAIRFPVFKGLYGYRVFLIIENEQAKFNKIKDLDGLKQLTGVQGTHWPDLQILQANGLKVESTSHHKSLYKMLEFGRVDYFPRGIHEPWKELKDRPNMGLAVEKNLMLYYPAPGYIFVEKTNTRLAKRFETGFKRIIDSGEFDRFFNNHPQIIEMKEQANMQNRTLIKLTNPLLSPLTPLQNDKLWYQVEK